MSSHAAPRRGLRSARVRAVLFLAVALALATPGTYAHWTDEGAVSGTTITSGTIDLRVDFLRQGVGIHFIASAEVMRLGSRVGSTQMRLHNDEGTLIATAAAAYIVS